MLRKYVHGGGVDEPLLWYEGAGLGVKRFLHADNQGSIVGATDISGTPLNASRYDAYGNRNNTYDTAASRFGYTGQMDLSELGLLNYKARMYDPKIGRFLQTDPSEYDDGINWYNYVGNDPINKYDPTGKSCQYTGRAFYRGTDNGNGHIDWNQPVSFEGYEIDCNGIDDNRYDDSERFGGGGSTGSWKVGNAVSSKKNSLLNRYLPFIKLTVQRNVSSKIGSGHAWTKHSGESLFKSSGIKTKGEFIRKIDSTINNGEMKVLTNGRMAFYDDQSKLLVIINPRDKDGGTAYFVKNRNKFDKLD